jgi:hypothetical protein
MEEGVQVMPTVKKLYEIWRSQPDNQARNRLVAEVLGIETQENGAIPDYCDNPNDAEKAVVKAWGSVEEETAPRYNCLIGETAQQGKKQCVIEWWPDDNTHIVTPRFETESEAKAFAAYLFATLEAE